MGLGINKYINRDEDNSKVDKHYRRRLCGCSFCRPHGHENATRYGKHGKTKPRYKDHR